MALALPGTVNGRAGLYEVWDQKLERVMVYQFDVFAPAPAAEEEEEQQQQAGEWALVGGPWTRRVWRGVNSFVEVEEGQEQEQEQKQEDCREEGAQERPQDERFYRV